MDQYTCCSYLLIIVYFIVAPVPSSLINSPTPISKLFTKSGVNQVIWSTTKKQHCISVAGVKLWNCINNNLRNSYSVLMFKKTQKNYMLNIM